ncbi:MAG TPA: PQQ-dependent sugar dehydrogenase [Saprospiraceae bacterium]|nr:PQQ-dependent sugar dehydrogenase [Saprospiraceae bacterium]
MKNLFFYIAFLVLSFNINGQTPFKLTQVASGFTRPLDLQNAGDARLFVVTQPGVISVLDSLKNTLTAPFLDIKTKVLSTGNEQGLLGLAFHPEYKKNGYFYVNYTRKPDGYTVIARYKVTADSNIADSNSEEILLIVPQPYTNHNGGCLQFGPDGYLYIGLGDGGSGGDPQANAQNTKKYLGKILRIDVDSGSPYGIPPDNPFVNGIDTLPEIWAIGLRNPWRFSFDKLTGDLFIADVGQNIWEEVDFEPANSSGGLNYGWRCYEGNATFNTAGCGPASNYVFPVHVHKHTSDPNCGGSISGGYIYRGSKYPGLYGKYLFADYCSGKFWALYKDNSGNWKESNIATLTLYEYSSFGQDKDGELFVIGNGSGKIFKIEMDCPSITADFATTYACKDSLNGQIQINSNSTLNYQWSNGDTSKIITNLAPGIYSVTLVDSVFCSKILDSIQVIEIDIDANLSQLNDTTLIINNPNNLINIQWYYYGSIIPGANDISLVVKNSGLYFAEFYYGGNCLFRTDTFNFITTGTQFKDKLIEIKYWPNPAKDQLSIIVNGLTNNLYSITVFNSWGQAVIFKTLTDKNTELSLTVLPAGIYAVEVRQSDKRKLIKFIKN